MPRLSLLATWLYTRSVLVQTKTPRQGRHGIMELMKFASSLYPLYISLMCVQRGCCQVLEAIAGKSLGGTFYDVEDGQNLSEHFSALLAGLLTVVVQDVKLTVWEQPGHSEVLDEGKVDAGSYAANKGERWLVRRRLRLSLRR